MAAAREETLVQARQVAPLLPAQIAMSWYISGTEPRSDGLAYRPWVTRLDSISNACSNEVVAGTLWPDGVPWDLMAAPRRRWMRRGRPWEAEFINLDELTSGDGGWRVNWTGRTARRGDLVYDELDEAMATVRWVIDQGGDWVEVDPDDARRILGENADADRRAAPGEFVPRG